MTARSNADVRGLAEAGKPPDAGESGLDTSGKLRRLSESGRLAAAGGECSERTVDATPGDGAELSPSASDSGASEAESESGSMSTHGRGTRVEPALLCWGKALSTLALPKLSENGRSWCGGMASSSCRVSHPRSLLVDGKGRGASESRRGEPVVVAVGGETGLNPEWGS